jgi:NAD/NADP transhydrogenase beta subunit
VFTGIRPAKQAEGVADSPGRASVADVAASPDQPGEQPADPQTAAVEALKGARRAIIVPGYGMAIAQAQFELVSLAKKLERNGVEVRYAIHPVAGRMPGHMNVLLAEADVPYDRLVEMDEINPEFAAADLVLVVGACDVVNPAAIELSGTPISGMPILRAMDAKAVVVCNYDDKPGYSGVDNPLYERKGSILLWGDAKQTLSRLNDLVGEEP